MNPFRHTQDCDTTIQRHLLDLMRVESTSSWAMSPFWDNDYKAAAYICTCRATLYRGVAWCVLGFTLLLALLIPASCFGADSWDTADKVLATTAVTGLVIDYAQTRTIMGSDEYEERNPIINSIGAGGVPIYFGVAILGTLGIAHYLPSDQRKFWLSIVSMVEVGMIANNVQLGIGLNF